MRLRPALAVVVPLLCAILFAGPPVTAAPVEYTVTDLGVLPDGDKSLGFGISFNPTAVGRATNAAGNDEAFYWAAGKMFGLGTLPGFLNSQAEGLNESWPYFPIAVGYCYNAPVPDDGRAFASVFGFMVDLGSLGGPLSRAHAIAGQGFIVGESQPGQAPAGVWHAFRTAPFSFINPATDDLGTLAGASSSFANAVNNIAQVTGQSGGHAYRTAPFAKINPATDDLGTLGGVFSIGFGINQLGTVAGLSNIAAISPLTGKPIDHAFLYDASGMHDLGTVPGFESSSASAINDHNQVVGAVSNVIPDVHAMIWDAVHGMRDLNTLISPAAGWLLQIGRGINDRGEIVGWGCTRAACTLTCCGRGMLRPDTVTSACNFRRQSQQTTGRSGICLGRPFLRQPAAMSTAKLTVHGAKREGRSDQQSERPSARLCFGTGHVPHRSSAVIALGSAARSCQ